MAQSVQAVCRRLPEPLAAAAAHSSPQHLGAAAPRSTPAHAAPAGGPPRAGPGLTHHSTSP